MSHWVSSFLLLPEFFLPRSPTYTSCLSNDHPASYYTNHNNKFSRSVQISHIIFICLYIYIYLSMQTMTPVWRPEYNLWEWFSPSIKGFLSIVLMTLSLVATGAFNFWTMHLGTNCLCFIWISLAFSTFFYSILLNDKTIPTCKLWCLALFFKPE